MNLKRRGYLSLLVLTAAAAMPAWGETGGTTTSIPDFSGIWWHPSLPGIEPLASGPTSVANRSRRNGVSNYDQLVDDFTNPILKPHTAEIVRNFGELSLKGITYPSPANQCWPEPVPFIYKNFAIADLSTAGQDHDHLRTRS